MGDEDRSRLQARRYGGQGSYGDRSEAGLACGRMTRSIQNAKCRVVYESTDEGQCFTVGAGYCLDREVRGAQDRSATHNSAIVPVNTLL